MAETVRTIYGAVANRKLRLWTPAFARMTSCRGMAVQKIYYVYIMASQKNGTTYIGVTNNIILRSTDHRDGKGSVFTIENRVRRLVYYEEYADVRDAIVREKQLKKWNRQWKIKLIEKDNREWLDLWFDLNR